MDPVHSIEKKLNDIVSKLDEMRELLIEHQKKKLVRDEEVFEPLLKSPNLPY